MIRCSTNSADARLSSSSIRRCRLRRAHLAWRSGQDRTAERSAAISATTVRPGGPLTAAHFTLRHERAFPAGILRVVVIGFSSYEPRKQGRMAGCGRLTGLSAIGVAARRRRHGHTAGGTAVRSGPDHFPAPGADLSSQIQTRRSWAAGHRGKAITRCSTKFPAAVPPLRAASGT